MGRLRRYFITGFIAVVPVFMTLYVLIAIFNFTDGILGRFLNVYLEDTLGFYVPGLGIFLFIFIIFLIGFLANRFIGRKLFSRLEKAFSMLPLISKIYPIFKQIVVFIMSQKEFGFRRVVLLEYPSKGIWSLGFLTNEELNKIDEATGKSLVSVFIPSSPGPLTGYVVFVPKEDLRYPAISVSEALRIIISGGVFKS